MKRITKVSSMLFLLLLTAWTQMFAAGGTEPPFNKTQALKASEIVAGKEIALWVVNTANNWYMGTKDNRSETLTDAVTFIVEDAGNGNIYLKRKSDSKYMKYTAVNTSASWVETTTDATAFVAKRPGNVEGGDDATFNYDYNSDQNLSTPPSWDSNYEYLVRFAVASVEPLVFINGNSAFATGTGNWSAFLVRDVNAETETYPFTLSDAPSNGQFAENTHWYYLKLNNRYLSYNAVTENYNYKGSNNKEQTFVYSYASNPLTYGCFWAFVKEGDDLKIYNAATGTSKVLSSNGSDERDFYPTMMPPRTEGYTDVWHYKDAQDITKFYLFLQGTKNKDEELYANDANKLNCYAGVNMTDGNPNNYLTFSTGAGEWSYFTVEEVDVPTAINSVKEQQKATSGAVGALVETDYENFTTEINKNTMEGLVEALKIRDLTGNTIPLISTQYYRLQNVYRTTDNGNTGKYMLGATVDGLTSEQMDLTNASLLWKIEKTNEENESTVKLYHANAQKMSGAIATTAGGKGVALSDEGAEYTMTKLGTAQYGFKIGSNYMVQFADNQIGSWNEPGNNSDHGWYIMPATSIEVEVTSVGYATVNYPFAVQLPSDDNSIKAYTGTINDSKDELILNEVENRLIPANTPVVLVSTSAQSDQTSKTYTLNIVADDTTPSISENALSGSLLSTNITTEDYILSTFNDIVGFYRLEANGALAANKAYISGNTINPTGVQGVRGFILSFDDNNGTTTNIEDSTIAPTEEAEEYYDLQGRRVLNPTKGIYVTKSGKKVLRLK